MATLQKFAATVIMTYYQYYYESLLYNAEHITFASLLG